jgi:Tfp pilus assembly protein PilF
MDSTAKELEAFRERLGAAQACLARQDWEGARRALDDAIAIDPLQPKPFDLMADVLSHLNRGEESATFRTRAKLLRQEQWKRQVEAEVRGQHELIGAPARHEIP